MTIDNRLINIRYKDGRVARISRADASSIVDTGKAQFISNTLYRQAPRVAQETKKEITKKQSDRAATRRKKKAEKDKKKSGDRSPPGAYGREAHLQRG